MGIFLPQLVFLRSSVAEAGSCTQTNTGNLRGYVETENLGRVYLSKESWDQDNPSRPAEVNFYVNYDPERNEWSGRGWNEAVGWVDFNYNQQEKKARFEAPGEEYDRLHDHDPNNDEPVEWGNWSGVIDLSGVSYSVQDGTFAGEGVDVDTNTGEGDEDEPVGSGKWTFAQVSYTPSTCPERVNLLINLKSVYHKSTCPIADGELTIQWTSENVEQCEAVAGPWTLGPVDPENTGTKVHNNAEISDKAIFTIRCKGTYSGVDITRSAVASCGSSQTNGGGDQGLITPVIIET